MFLEILPDILSNKIDREACFRLFLSEVQLLLFVILANDIVNADLPEGVQDCLCHCFLYFRQYDVLHIYLRKKFHSTACT
jgi:hypothetical protein